MKIVCALIIGALLSMPPVGQRPAPDPLDDLFARGRTAQAAIKTVSASFTETSVSSLLRDPLVATGTLLATVPVRVVMSYTSPTVKTVALDDTRLVIAWGSGRQREEINIAETQRRVQKYFGQVSPQQLRETFTIAMSSDPTRDAYRLDMVPKRRQVAEGLDRLQIWIDPARLMMIKMVLEYPGGDSKTLELHDIRTNVAIDESTFALLARRR